MLTKITRLLIGLASLLALTGCGAPVFLTPLRTSAAERPTQPAPLPNPTAALPPSSRSGIPALTGDWQISLEQSGGIMGMSRKLVVSSSGTASLTDLRSQKSTQIILSGEELKSLAGLLADSRYKVPASASGCADCFLFALEVSSSSGTFSVELDELELADSGLQPLVAFLGKYINPAR